MSEPESEAALGEGKVSAPGDICDERRGVCGITSGADRMVVSP